MSLPRFEYVEPKTVDEACALLAERKERAKVLAGGTDLLVSMKQRILTPDYVINLKRVPGLSYIEEDTGCLRLGALTTLRKVEASPTVRELFPLLADAAGSVATRQVRTTATLGGNLCLDSRCWYYNQSHTWRKSREACLKRGGDVCHVVKGGKRCYAVLSGDTVPALLALSAKVKIVSSGGQRVIPLEEFFTGVGETPNVLTPEEIVVEVQVPYMPSNSRGVFIKHSQRGAIDFAIVNAAAVVTRDDGVCKDAKIVISSIGPAAATVKEANQFLQGKKVDEAVLEGLAEAAVKGARLVSGAYSSVYYRRKLINVLTKRVVKQAMGIA